MAGAQGDKPVAAPAWTTTISAGANLTRGNSETLALNGSVRAELKPGANEVALGVEANYGESTATDTNGVENTETTVDNQRAFGQYRRLLSERAFASLNAELLRDDVAGINYRLTVGPGVGYYLLKGDVHNLMIEAGPAYITEELEDSAGDTSRDDRWAIRAVERYDLQFSKTAKLWEQVEYLPTADDFDAYLLNAEAGVEAAMTTAVGLRLVGQYKYNSEPAAGREREDFSLIAGVTVKL